MKWGCLCVLSKFRQNANGVEDTSGMWYFAYGSNLNSRAVAEWCRHYGYRAPAMRPGKPAVLDNYRLSFPIFSEYWAGGIGDIVYDPGKYVMGALFDLSENELNVLDAKVNRKLDSNSKEIGTYKRIEVKSQQPRQIRFDLRHHLSGHQRRAIPHPPHAALHGSGHPGCVQLWIINDVDCISAKLPAAAGKETAPAGDRGRRVKTVVSQQSYRACR
jgi:hypothetical protein